MSDTETPPVILVIDDDPFHLLTVKTALEVHDLQVVTATSGKEGWEIFQTQSKWGYFSAVITDGRMEGLDGLSVVFLCNTSPLCEYDVPIIMYTGEDRFFRRRARDMGALVFRKPDEHYPGDLDTMVAKVAAWVKAD